MSSPSPNPPAPKRRGLLVILIALGLIAVPLAIWLGTRKPSNNNLMAATEANNRGVGLMGRSEEKQANGRTAFQNAATEFEEAARLAPDWMPAKVNLAIALYNSTVDPADPVLSQAISLFEEVLKRDPDNPHAHYNLGIIFLYRDRVLEAEKHFEAVTKFDPNDAHGWYQLGVAHPDRYDSPVAKGYFLKALELDPYLNAARYALYGHNHDRDPIRIAALMKEFNNLDTNDLTHEIKTRYSDMGRYAEVIGASPVAATYTCPMPIFAQENSLQVTLAEGTRWAKTEDLNAALVGIREKFGGAIVRFDYDSDGLPDLMLLSAIVRDNKLGDVVLHNDGNGKFTDTTATVGLLGTASYGAAIADFDNSGTPDVLLTGPNGIRLFANIDGKRFEDKTVAAGFDKITGVCLGAVWADLDQDGDLDLLVAGYGNGRLLAFANIGEAPPSLPNTPVLPLSCRFQPIDEPALRVDGPVTSILVSDLDGDNDIDIIAFVEGRAPIIILNDRMLRFHRADETLAPALSGLVLDSNNDEQPDLFLTVPKAKPQLFVSTTDASRYELKGRFVPGANDSPALVQAQTIDLDLDGAADVIGLSVDGKPVFLRGDAKGKLTKVPDAFGPKPEAITNLLAVASFDDDGDGNPDLLLWPRGEAPQLYRNMGNGNRGLKITLTGRRDKGSNLRSNSDGIGARAIAMTGPLRSMIENTTLSAGLTQSRLPLGLGIGKSPLAEVVRLRWPDQIPQAELNVPATQITKIIELNRKGTSCPILFTWDGERYRYVTDFLGAGAMGELGADGSVRPPRPQESVKIEADQLVLKNGKYSIKIAEPMDEVLYIDRVVLEVVDHPKDVRVYPNERFVTAGPQPSQELLAFAQMIAPTHAVDHRNRDVLATLKERDGRTVDQFATRSWLGYAEEHFVELDFANSLSKLDAKAPLYLVMAGWTDYPYPESIYAATQAGVPMQPPVLENQRADGTWESLGEIGFPAGLPRVMTVPVAGIAGTANVKLRIRTNLQIYWDQIQFGTVEPQTKVRTQTLPASVAKLQHRGFAQEFSPNGKPPIAYDYDRTEPVATTHWQGRLTRLGDVMELLQNEDDRFVLCGPGDEITIEFDASTLPPVAADSVRSFVLRTAGYCKDTSPFTKTAGRVGPLPFRGMASYPDGATDRKLAPPAQEEYDRTWNTRPAGGR